MFHHVVFFYLKKDITAAQRAEFEVVIRPRLLSVDELQWLAAILASGLAALHTALQGTEQTGRQLDPQTSG